MPDLKAFAQIPLTSIVLSLCSVWAERLSGHRETGLFEREDRVCPHGSLGGRHFGS